MIRAGNEVSKFLQDTSEWVEDGIGMTTITGGGQICITGAAEVGLVLAGVAERIPVLIGRTTMHARPGLRERPEKGQRWAAARGSGHLRQPGRRVVRNEMGRRTCWWVKGSCGYTWCMGEHCWRGRTREPD